MALTPQHLAQRIKAARGEAGLKQSELSAKFEAEGHGKTDIGRLERPDGSQKPPPLTPARVKTLVEITGVPANWFTEPDFFGLSEPEPREVDQLRQELREEIDAAKVELLEELEKALDAQASGQRWTRPGVGG